MTRPVAGLREIVEGGARTPYRRGPALGSDAYLVRGMIGLATRRLPGP